MSSLSTPSADHQKTDAKPANPNAWIGVDLDGTLAAYDEWRGFDHIGDPVPLMLDRVKTWLAAGKKVKIVTARVAAEEDLHDGSPTEVLRAADAARMAVVQWCEKHVGQVLDITCRKDFDMVELWDDRAVTVQKNTGIAVTEHLQFMREDVAMIGIACGLRPLRGENFHTLCTRIIAALQDSHAEADTGLELLLHVHGDKFKGGEHSQAFKDLCLARRNLQTIAARHVKSKAPEPTAKPEPKKEETPNAE